MAPRLVFAVFIVLQAADGWLTYEAVELFGMSAEANPILHTWMHLAGLVPDLLGAVVPWLQVFSSMST